MESLDYLLQNFIDALLQINRSRAAEIFEDLSHKATDFQMLDKIVMQALEAIGRDWEAGSVSLSQVYMAGIICEELIDQYLPEQNIKRSNTPKTGIGVLLDYHGLGKRMVYSTLRAGGIDVIDLGLGLSVEEMVERTMDEGIEILLISTLMLPSAMKVRSVRDLLTERGYKGKLIVGGAPFRLDPELWKQVGADATSGSAGDILLTIEGLVKEV
jgi:methanogenic corrinoid protein MtbC1